MYHHHFLASQYGQQRKLYYSPIAFAPRLLHHMKMCIFVIILTIIVKLYKIAERSQEFQFIFHAFGLSLTPLHFFHRVSGTKRNGNLIDGYFLIITIPTC